MALTATQQKAAERLLANDYHDAIRGLDQAIHLERNRIVAEIKATWTIDADLDAAIVELNKAAKKFDKAFEKAQEKVQAKGSKIGMGRHNLAFYETRESPLPTDGFTFKDQAREEACAKACAHLSDTRAVREVLDEAFKVAERKILLGVLDKETLEEDLRMPDIATLVAALKP